MAANLFGNRLQMMTFGESHGPAMGVVIDGLPSGVPYIESILLDNLKRRKPGGNLVSPRNELDQPKILSGVFAGKTLGTPVAVVVENRDQRTQDYDDLKARPGHADQVWKDKFTHVDHRGGGRSSGRETVSRVIAGSFAQMYLKTQSPDCFVKAFSYQIGPFVLSEAENKTAILKDISSFPGAFPSETALEVKGALEKAQKEGQSFGGIVRAIVHLPPKSLGQPVFHKLKADLASAILGIGAVNSLQLGDSPTQLGTDFHHSNTLHQYGGIQGGISNGEDIVLEIGIKPTSSINGVAKSGRHDAYIGTRAIPVIESMIYFVLADHQLWQKTDSI